MDFEDVKKVLGEAANTVVQKSGEAWEFGKIKYAIYDAQNDINKIFAQLGQLVYEGTSSGELNDGQIREKCNAIDAKKMEIVELEDKLAVLKNSKKCPGCGKFCKKEDVFCAACGYRF